MTATMTSTDPASDRATGTLTDGTPVPPTDAEDSRKTVNLPGEGSVFVGNDRKAVPTPATGEGRRPPGEPDMTVACVSDEVEMKVPAEADPAATADGPLTASDPGQLTWPTATTAVPIVVIDGPPPSWAAPPAAGNHGDLPGTALPARVLSTSAEPDPALTDGPPPAGSGPHDGTVGADGAPVAAAPAHEAGADEPTPAADRPAEAGAPHAGGMADGPIAAALAASAPLVVGADLSLTGRPFEERQATVSWPTATGPVPAVFVEDPTGPVMLMTAEHVALAVADDAFDRFYRTEKPRVVAIVASLTGDRNAAEDIVQEAFATAMRRWATVSAYDRPADWVKRVAVNRAISRFRRRQSESKALTRLVGRGDDEAGVSFDLDGQGALDDPLWAAVRRLPRRQAQAVALVYIDDLSVERVAEILQCSVGSVKTHLHRARQRLAAELTPGTA
jgi:RNA polymerase sigma-70 factor (sigma-E family)